MFGISIIQTFSGRVRVHHSSVGRETSPGIIWEIYFGSGFVFGAIYSGKTADRIAKRGK